MIQESTNPNNIGLYVFKRQYRGFPFDNKGRPRYDVKAIIGILHDEHNGRALIYHDDTDGGDHAGLTIIFGSSVMDRDIRRGYHELKFDHIAPHFRYNGEHSFSRTHYERLFEITGFDEDIKDPRTGTKKQSVHFPQGSMEIDQFRELLSETDGNEAYS